MKASKIRATSHTPAVRENSGSVQNIIGNLWLTIPDAASWIESEANSSR